MTQKNKTYKIFNYTKFYFTDINFKYLIKPKQIFLKNNYLINKSFTIILN